MYMNNWSNINILLELLETFGKVLADVKHLNVEMFHIKPFSTSQVRLHHHIHAIKIQYLHIQLYHLPDIKTRTTCMLKSVTSYGGVTSHSIYYLYSFDHVIHFV